MNLAGYSDAELERIANGGAPSNSSRPLSQYSNDELSRIANGSSTPSRLDAFGYNFADGATFGFGDEAAGALAGAGAVLGGGDYAMAYRQRVDAARQRLEAAREAHPVTSMIGTLGGATATFLIPGGAAATGARFGVGGLQTAGRVGQALATGRALPFGSQLASQAAGRGAGAIASQVGLGAMQGGLYGGLYGAGAANEGDRFDGALQGATWGAIAGGLVPPAFQLLGRFGRAVYPNPAARTAIGGALGGGIGYTQGETDEERQQNAMRGAAFGAGAGAALRPLVSNVGGPLLRAWRNPRAAFGNSTGMSFGIPPVGDDAASSAGAPIIDQATLRSVDRTLGRQNRGVTDLENQIQATRGEPLGRTLADLNPEFSAELDAIANMPGQTFSRAQAVAQERAQRLPEQLQTELRDMLGVRMSPVQALDEIRAGVASASDGYEQALAQAPVREIVETRIAPLLATPEMQPALARRFRVEEGRAQLARVRGEAAPERSIVRTEDGAYRLSPNASARSLHEIKTSIDDELSAAADRRSLSPAGREEQRLLDDYRTSYISALDDALPGAEGAPSYAAVRGQRGSLYDAEQALGLDANGNARMGRDLLRMRPEEIASRMRETVTQTGRVRPTTPFEREMYRISVADEIMQRIDDYVSASSDKVRNAGEVLDKRGLQNRLRAVFGNNPEAIEQFLNRAIERAEMLRRAASWTGNSASARRMMRGGDRFMASLSEAGANMATGNPGVAASAIGRGAWHALRGRVLERQNDAFGSALLRNVEGTSAQDEAYLQALLRELRKMEQARIARAESAGRDSAINAIAPQGHLDDSGGYY